MRLAVVFARRRARRRWNDERQRRLAREVVRVVVGNDVSQDRVDELARAHLLENAIRDEFFWRPRAIERARIDGCHHLRDALASGRGVIVSYCHQGPHAGSSILIHKCGAPRVHIPGGKVVFEERKSRSEERYQRQHRLLSERGKGRFLPAKGSYETLASLLAEGEVLGLAFDVKGRTPTPFFGRTIHMTSGTARLAVETDSLVVPLLRGHDGHRFTARMEAALDPRDVGEMQDLHEALARHHDAWIAENPAAIRRTSLIKHLVETGG